MATTEEILVLTTGDPAPPVQRQHGGFADMLRRAIGPRFVGRYVDVDVRSATLVRLEQLLDANRHRPCAVLITGSPASVTAGEPWMQQTATWLLQLVERGIPTLGICFGHQLLAHALGGRVGANPAGHELGTRAIERVGDEPLLGIEERNFFANCYHGDTVLHPPPGARVLARSARDSYHCLQFAPRCFGVQFHPEFDARVMRALLAARREDVAALGLWSPQLLDEVRDAPVARRVLQRFVAAASSG